MNKLRLDACKTPFSHVIIVTLFAIGVVALPFDILVKSFITEGRTLYYVSQAIPRIIFSVVAVIFIKKYQFGKIFSSINGVGVLLMIPALLVCVNNAPIVGLITGNVTFEGDVGVVVAYLVYCISVGFFEELVFRGIIFPLCVISQTKYKNGIFWSVVISSAVFSASHLVNLFAGMGVGAVILQLGYTFLVGAMCSISLVKTKNIFFSVFLHTVYDVGGLGLVNVNNAGGLLKGNQWDTLTVIITAVLGVIVCVYMIFVLLKSDGNDTKTLLEIKEDGTAVLGKSGENNCAEKEDK